MKMFGKGFSKTLIETTSNPFIGLFIGILATSLMQSSSSTTSMVVAMIAGGAFGTDYLISNNHTTGFYFLNHLKFNVFSHHRDLTSEFHVMIINRRDEYLS